jgi:hypothetical protein
MDEETFKSCNCLKIKKNKIRASYYDLADPCPPTTLPDEGSTVSDTCIYVKCMKSSCFCSANTVETHENVSKPVHFMFEV